MGLHIFSKEVRYGALITVINTSKLNLTDKKENKVYDSKKGMVT